MKLAKLFLDRPVGLEVGCANFNVVPHVKATPQTSSIVFEWPIVDREVAFVTRCFLPKRGMYWNMGLWTVTDEAIAQIVSGPFLAVSQQPTLAMQKVVKFARDEWAPTAKVFRERGAPFDQLLATWFNYPDVFYTYVARHKRPSLLSRQNFYTVLRWPAWNYTRRTMQERVDEMTKNGCGGGKLTAKNLSKRASDLGLS